jgi:hypothetical protein
MYKAPCTTIRSICLNPKPVSPAENQKRTVSSVSGFRYGSNELATKLAELLSVSVFPPAIEQLSRATGMAIAEEDSGCKPTLPQPRETISIGGGSHEEIVTPNHFVELISSGRNLCIG